MRTRVWSAVCALLLLFSSAAAADELTLTMNEGWVTVVADNVTLRQILAEWANVGQTTIVGAENLSGPPVTLYLKNVSERQALETLLRSASGYMAAPRPLPAEPGVSVYDRILILPASVAPATAGPTGPGSRPFIQEPPPFDFSEPLPEEVDLTDLPSDFTEAQRRGLDPGDFPDLDVPVTEFDYANPQLNPQLFPPEPPPMQDQTPTTSAVPGVIIQPPAQAPNVFPGTVTPSSAAPPPPVSARPGEMVQPAQPMQFNPYGLPAGIQPGSVQGGSIPPDRAKYMNPYQPAPEVVPQ